MPVTRKFCGKVYRSRRQFKNKLKAQAEAASYRKKHGVNARVITLGKKWQKMAGRYAVFSQ